MNTFRLTKTKLGEKVLTRVGEQDNEGGGVVVVVWGGGGGLMRGEEKRSDVDQMVSRTTNITS